MADDSAVLREIQQLREDIKDDFVQMRAEIARKADAELTQERHRGTDRRITVLEAAREHDEERKRADRRWVIAAIVIPVAIALVQLLASLRGGGA